MGVVATLGDLLLDVSCRPSTTLRPDTDTPSANTLEAGGQAANVAAWAATSGAAARLICRRADDPAGRLAAERCRMRGVAVVGPSGSGPSGIVVALVGGDGGRSMLTDRGTSALLAPADIDERFLDDVSWLFVSCYSLLAEPTIGAALRAVALARARGASIAVDIASRGAIEEVGVEGVLALVREINPDIVLATADELALVPAGAIALASLTVLKQGPRGAGLRGRINVDRPPCAGRVIDTLGAGDALTGGMLAALARGAHPVDALDAGMRAAASCVERRGAMPPVPGEPTA